MIFIKLVLLCSLSRSPFIGRKLWVSPELSSIQTRSFDLIKILSVQTAVNNYRVWNLPNNNRMSVSFLMVTIRSRGLSTLDPGVPPPPAHGDPGDISAGEEEVKEGIVDSLDLALAKHFPGLHVLRREVSNSVYIHLLECHRVKLI